LLETQHDRRELAGVHIILSDGGTDAAREQRAAAVLQTGFFYCASRFRIIEGTPEPPGWLEVFETDLKDPLSAHAPAGAAMAPPPAVGDIRQGSSHSYALVVAHEAGAGRRGRRG
jgi:hypothetical protein